MKNRATLRNDQKYRITKVVKVHIGAEDIISAAYYLDKEIDHKDRPEIEKMAAYVSITENHFIFDGITKEEIKTIANKLKRIFRDIPPHEFDLALSDYYTK